jgi:muconolactone delta-isomerase
MEYLVTMTTSVPDGTPDQAVRDMRAREAAHTRELAARGYVLRLWRPPLAPGEWRTLGLFAAAGPAELDRVLTSMPLWVWRTDETEGLTSHPNDPARGISPAPPAPEAATAAEFLVTFTPDVPGGTPAADVADATVREAERVRELAKLGEVIRVWALPAVDGVTPVLGLYRAGSDEELQAILQSLPLRPYLRTRTVSLSPHPSDPAAPGSRERAGGAHD